MHILQGEALQSYNTLALAGHARALVRVVDHGQLLEALFLGFKYLHLKLF